MNNKKNYIYLIFLLLIFFSPFQGKADIFKIGFHFGKPNAVIICPNSRVQIGIGDIGTKTFHIHMDFQLLQSKISENLFFYLSLGGQLTSYQKQLDWAVRLPLGLTININNNLDLFLQAAAVQHLSPQTNFDWQWGGGIRFRFR